VENFSQNIKIEVCSKLYVKDPFSSALGRKIITESLILIDNIGLENFTFKKLSKVLDTTESSVYRYFENKQKLLLFCISWFWSWLDILIMIQVQNIPDGKEKLKKAIYIICSLDDDGLTNKDINIPLLKRVVISESSKAYLTHEVDAANKEGAYLAYKQLVGRVSSYAREINPSFKYARTLITTIIEGAFHQRFFAKHLPSLTDITEEKDNLEEFYTQMALNTIRK